jgi:hypothetical protein
MLYDLADRLPAALAALDRCTGTIPAAGGGTGGSSGISDRTGRLALAIIDGCDPAIVDARLLDGLERTIIARLKLGQPIAHQLAQVLDIVDRWAPTPKRRRAIESTLRQAAEGKGDDGCLSCARIKNHQGDPVYSEQHPGLKVCKSCHDMLKRVRAHAKFVDAELVPLAVMQWRQRHAGKQVSPDILERLLRGRDA